MDHLPIVISFSDSTDIDIQKLKSRKEFDNSMAVLNLGYGYHYDLMTALSEQARETVIAKIVEAGVACVVMSEANYLGPATHGWKNEFAERKINILSYAETIDNAMSYMALWLKSNQDHKDYTGCKIEYSFMRNTNLNRIVKPTNIRG